MECSLTVLYKIINQGRCVLILVLMEDTLGVLIWISNAMTRLVLILVLMEDTLGEQKIDLSDNQYFTRSFSQNPLDFHKN